MAGIAQHEVALVAGQSSEKSRHGQFFTMASPFENPAFEGWLGSIPDGTLFVEPFAGANNLVRMVDELRRGLVWDCFDIEPQHPSVAKRDVIANYPATRRPAAVVTNPPYLAKNVARRVGYHDLAERCGRYDNVYKLCLDRCLSHSEWVAAIIPESFVTSGQFHERLDDVVSLDRPMFVDTEVPVCLALWGPAHSESFQVWKGALLLGDWNALQSHRPSVSSSRIQFNNPNGEIALLAVDSPKRPSIAFCRGEVIAPSEIKHSSRHRTRISVSGLNTKRVSLLIDATNVRLADLREATCDVGLTAFMGTRADGWYRRRLDFATARALLSQALLDIGENL